jgi:hypothetical protein
MERLITFKPAYDKRDDDPSKDLGVHGVTLRMVLKGKGGAYHFVLYTNWQLPHVRKEWRLSFAGPLPADAGYHSPIPQYEGQELSQEHCEYLDGQPCYYDGSALYADKVFKMLVEHGSEAVWEELERLYKERFGDE